MLRAKTISLIGVLACFCAPGANAGSIFEQNFGCDGGSDSGDANYRNDQCGSATTPQTWTNPNSPGSGAYESTNPDWSVGETVFVGGGTRTGEGTPSNFSVNAPTTYGPNWNIHDGDDNEWVSGYKTPSGGLHNDQMSGNMLGHEDENYNNSESNYYQISDLSLATNATDHQLMFDFDSWISDYYVWNGSGYVRDSDAFAVAIATGIGSTNFSLLDSYGAGNEMVYRDQKCDTTLGSLTGQNCTGTVQGFDGGGGTTMAGTAIFDLSAFAGQTVSLRFAFASNNKEKSGGGSSVAEGINIDNIKVTQNCIVGTDPECNPPGGGSVPEPATFALALLGLSATYRRRRKTR